MTTCILGVIITVIQVFFLSGIKINSNWNIQLEYINTII